MKAARRRQGGKDALELVEEATHVLRTAPLPTLATYAVGAVPFVLGFLYFWMDMSRSPFAHGHVAEMSFGLALLFFWMKWWQALFARRIRAAISAEPMPRWSVAQGLRQLAQQSFLHSWALLPLALVVLVAFAFVPAAILLLPALFWILSLFQNVTAIAHERNESVRETLQTAWRLWSLWPRQNVGVLLVVSVFALVVFINWTAACLFVPELGRMLFGIESMFTQNPNGMLNTTFFLAMGGLTFLSVDPLVKVTYVLRCFYGESLTSGEDLKAELKRLSVSVPGPALIALVALLGAALPARGAEAPSTAPESVARRAVSPEQLDRAIGEVIQQRKYSWRMPREAVADDAEKGVITRFVENAGRMLRSWVRAGMEWIDAILEKLFKRKRVLQADGSSGYGWMVTSQLLLYVLVCVAAAALAVFLYRVWRRRRNRPQPAVSEPIRPAPDLMDEHIAADQLPEDEWTKLGRELMERGEFRLAMRAFYLASLAHLAGRNLIRIARFKSNREYEAELRRRAHSIPALISLFSDNISVFERIWYGMHEADGELVRRFAEKVQRMRTGA